MIYNESITYAYAPSDFDIKIVKWRVRESCPINNSQVILHYEVIDNGNNNNNKEINRLKAHKNGVVKKLLYEINATVRKGEPLLELYECLHTTVIKDMCANCGADLRENENQSTTKASVPMIPSIPDLKVTQNLAKQLGQADTERLLKDRKLVLLVDLDQTLIHTTNDDIPNNINGIHHFQLQIPNIPHPIWYHTRLRPYTLEFLNKIASYFELHIFTFGARKYADIIAKILDPKGNLFSNRILSRDECFNVTYKTDNIKSLFPCGDSMVCIIDDRQDVWNMASNLIQVKPYYFFQTGDINSPSEFTKNQSNEKGVDCKENVNVSPNSCLNLTKPDEIITKNHAVKTNSTNSIKKVIKNDILNSYSKDTTKINQDDENIKNTKINNETNIEKNCITENSITTDTKDEENQKQQELPTSSSLETETEQELIEINDPDNYLLYLEKILMKIHKTFYEIYDEQKTIPDLKCLIPQIRSNVLKGLHLVFSGLISYKSEFENNRVYLIAKSLGADVTRNFTNDTTHLVSIAASTYKYYYAYKCKNIQIVSPEWLWCSAERWDKADEKLFQLKKPNKMQKKPTHFSIPRHIIVNYTKSQRKNQIQSIKCEENFKDSINPLLSFSKNDLAEMNQECDQLLESDKSSDDEHDGIEIPTIYKLFLKRKRKDNDEERLRKLFLRRKNTNLIIEKIVNDQKNVQYNSNENQVEDNIDDKDNEN